MNFKKLSVFTAAMLVMSNLFFALPAQAAENTVQTTTAKTYTSVRIQGASRMDTAANIAADCYPGMVDDVVITTAWDFPDALSGSALAAKLNAPVLSIGYGQKDSVSTIKYIHAHLNKGGTIHILGGTGAVRKAIEDFLKGEGYKTDRIGGTNRFDTAKLICERVAPAKGTPVFLAVNDNYPDALSASTISAIKGYPILLSRRNQLTDATYTELQNVQPSTVYILGGIGVISDDVIAQIKGAVQGIQDSSIVRLAGENRFKTSTAVAKYFNLDTKDAVITTGYNFPDALAGSILGYKMNAPMLLVGKNENGDKIADQKQYLDSSSITNLYILGGKGAISDSMVDLLTKPVVGQ